MARRKKSKKKKENFSISDFRIKAATVGSVDVSSVTGRTGIGTGKNYTAYVNTTVTETTASIDAVLTGVSASPGHSVAITTTLPVIITASTVLNTVPTEILSTISCGGTGVSACSIVDSGTLSLVTSVSTLKPLTLSMDVSAGTYVVIDNGTGSLSSSPSGFTGSVDYSTGAWTITGGEILTNGIIISGDYDVQYLYEQTATSVVIKHIVGSDAAINGTANGIVSALALDPAAATAYTSTVFTLSTDPVASYNPWEGHGALPGETRLETAGRFIDEGVI